MMVKSLKYQPKPWNHLMRGDSMKQVFAWYPVNKCIFRPKIIRAISENVGSEILPNKKCIIHLIDIGSMNLTKDYLKSAWKKGSIGATHFYLIKIKAIEHLGSLNFSEIFDFQRLFLAAPSGVWTYFTLSKTRTNNILYHFSKI